MFAFELRRSFLSSDSSCGKHQVPWAPHRDLSSPASWSWYQRWETWIGIEKMTRCYANLHQTVDTDIKQTY